MNSLLIGAFCIHSSLLSGPNDMCSQTSEAMSRQFGFYQNVSLMEGYATDQANRKAGFWLTNAVVYSAAAYRVESGGSAKIGFHFPTLCDRVELSGSKQTNGINFNWRW